MSSSVPVAPVELSAFSISPAAAKRLKLTTREAANVWLVPCPSCGRMHRHGAAEGHRVAHCPTAYTPKGGYVLKYAGVATAEDVDQWQADAMAAFRREQDAATAHLKRRPREVRVILSKK
jgi:hypothetical protein